MANRKNIEAYLSAQKEAKDLRSATVVVPFTLEDITPHSGQKRSQIAAVNAGHFIKAGMCVR